MLWDTATLYIPAPLRRRNPPRSRGRVVCLGGGAVAVAVHIARRCVGRAAIAGQPYASACTPHDLCLRAEAARTFEKGRLQVRQDGDQAAVLRGHRGALHTLLLLLLLAHTREGGSLGGVSLDCHLHHTRGALPGGPLRPEVGVVEGLCVDGCRRSWTFLVRQRRFELHAFIRHAARIECLHVVVAGVYSSPLTNLFAAHSDVYMSQGPDTTRSACVCARR